MAYQKLRMRNDVLNYKFQSTLDGVVYTLRFKYNARLGRWYMDVMDAEETPLLMGRPLFTDYVTNARFVGDSRPPGRFIVYDLTGANADPGRDSFGSTHELYYEEAS